MRNIINVGTENNNSYLIDGEILIDVPPEDCIDSLISRVDLKKVQYIMLCGSNPVRCGGIGRLLDVNPELCIVGTPGTIKNAGEIINRDFRSVTAKEGGTLSGIMFKVMPYFPWPDCMVLYDEESKTLFSGYMFSSYADGDMTRFRDENIPYYSDYSEYAAGEIEKLEISEILPSCGKKVLYSKDVLNLYAPAEKCEKYTAVIYYSRFGYTREAAELASRRAKAFGEVRFAEAESEAASKLITNASAVIIGTPTINRAVPHEVIEAIANADSVKLIGKPFAVIGSYGWSGEGLSVVYAYLKGLRADVYKKPFRFSFRLSEKKKNELTEYIDGFLKEAYEE